MQNLSQRCFEIGTVVIIGVNDADVTQLLFEVQVVQLNPWFSFFLLEVRLDVFATFFKRMFELLAVNFVLVHHVNCKNATQLS
jgi:hypothetical protein